MPTPRPLRRLRRALGAVAMLTALAIAAACRLDAVGRAVAATVALAGLVAWVMLLDLEGRTAERLETRMRRRLATRRTPAQRAPVRRGGEGRRRKAA